MTRTVDETTHVDELRQLEADTAGANTEELAAQVMALLDKRSPRPLSR
jgi:hypothetical protein